MTCQGLVLDVDGTLMASEDADAQAWMEEFAAAGAPITMEQYAHWWSDWSWHRKTTMITRLAALAPGIDQDQVSARRVARYAALCANLPLCPGMGSWLAEARTYGLQIAVATNDATGRVRDHLDRLGLTSQLAAIVTPADGARLKPAPDLYLTAATELVPAAECLAIEDAPHGARAAPRAGYAGVIVVPNARHHPPGPRSRRRPARWGTAGGALPRPGRDLAGRRPGQSRPGRPRRSARIVTRTTGRPGRTLEQAVDMQMPLRSPHGRRHRMAGVRSGAAGRGR